MTTVLNQIATTVKGWNWLNNEENPFLQNIGNNSILFSKYPGGRRIACFDYTS